MEPLIIIVLAFSAISVSRAEESLSLFVRKGGSVHLDVQGYEKLQNQILSWNFNSTGILQYNIKFKDLTLYDNNYDKTRTEFDQKNFTLLLKNVQKRHSGIYTANIFDIGRLREVASYRLIVQEAPPTPQVRVVFLSSDGGFCNVSVNCSAKDTWASYTCDHAHCTQVENTTLPTEVYIIVTATNGTIHCNSSNRVGTKTQSESTKDICLPKEKTWDKLIHLSWIIIFLILIGISIFVLYTKKRKSRGSQIQVQCNTEYASVEGPGVVHSNPSAEVTVYETVTTAKPEHHPKVNTVYDTLGPAGDPPTQPESVYATVNKGAS